MDRRYRNEAEALAFLDRSSLGAPQVLEAYRRADPDKIRRVRETAERLDGIGFPLDDEPVPSVSSDGPPKDEPEPADRPTAQPLADPAQACRVNVWKASGMSGADVVDSAAYRALHRAPVHRLPPHVHGRDALVGDVRRALASSTPSAVALVGPIGCGKSTVALTVVRAFDPTGERTWWISAGNGAELAEELYGVAAGAGATVDELNELRRLDREQRCARLCELLAVLLPQGLLVLEDATEDVVHAMSRVARRPALLVTSRTEDSEIWGAGTVVVPVAPLDVADGALVLLDQLGRRGVPPGETDRRHAHVVADRFGGVPLALRNVGALLAAMPPERSILDALGALALDGDGDPHAVLASVYEVSLATIDRAGHPEARELLRLLSCFGDSPIPDVILREAGDRVPAALESLVRVALVERAPASESGHLCVRVHPAVSRLARADRRLDPAAVGRLEQRAAGMLLRGAERLDPGAPDDWAGVRLLHPLAVELVESLTSGDVELRADTTRSADRVAVGLARAGDQPGAIRLVDRALSRSGPLGDRHPALLALRRTQAWLVGLDGDLPGAEQLLRELLAVQQSVLGYDDRATLATRDCLAWTLAEQGELRRAAVRFATLVRSCVAALGDDDPDTLAVRHRMAWVTALLGHRTVASEELERVLALRTVRLGPRHLDVFSTRYRLAWVRTLRGQVVEGERRFRDLQRDVHDALGADHPITLMVRWRHGWALHWQSRLEEAAAVYRELAVDQEKRLGAEHPRTLRTRHGLACLLVHGGRLGEAETALRGVLADRARILGPDHRSTLDSRSYLAWALSSAGKLKESETELRGLLPDRARVLGPRHPETLRTRLLLAEVFLKSGRLDEADHWLAELSTRAKQLLDPDSRLVFDVREAQARLTGLRGRLAAAETQLREVGADRERVLGPRHRETISTGDHLVWVVGSQGRLDEAEQLCHELLDLCHAVHGPEHPAALAARYRMAWLAVLAGRLDDAGSRFRELVVDLEDALGPRHPDTLRGRLGSAWVRRLGGDLIGAMTAYRDLLRDCTRFLGRTSVMTLRVRDGLGLVLLAQDRAGKAERLFAALLRDTEQVLGSGHRDTLVVREHLARSWVRQGRFEEAYAELAHVEWQRAGFDRSHPDVRRAIRSEFLDRNRKPRRSRSAGTW